MAAMRNGNGPETKPNPDPTARTLEESMKAVSGLKELMEARIATLERELGLIRATVDARPAAVVAEIAHLKTLTEEKFHAVVDLMAEKFKGVADQFSGRDTALAAALLAQKTSVEEQNKSNSASATKSEAATTKQIDGIQTLLINMSQGTDVKIEGVKALLSVQEKAYDKALADLSTRITAREGASAGVGSVIAYIFAGIGGLVGIGAIIGLVTKMGGGN